ncbi:MAG: ABC transporter permease [Lachnospiraceae bacterium]|nr:ABC transporter permease [Lachnospiraceae bacterium]
MKRFLNDLRRYWAYTLYSAKSQLKSEVANSYLNWVWWVLEPFCFMLIYSFVFGTLIGRKIEYYNIYIFAGLALWDFFNRCIKSSVRMVKRHKPIVSRVYLPKFTLIISDIMVSAFKMMICLGITLCMLAVYRVPVTVNILFVFPIVITMMLLTYACETILLHLGVFIEDMANVVNILLRFLFYLTGIFYNIRTILEEPYSSILVKLNPVALLIESLRNCMIYGKTPDLKIIINWFFISLIVAVLGTRNIYKNENTYVKVI